MVTNEKQRKAKLTNNYRCFQGGLNIEHSAKLAYRPTLTAERYNN